MVLDGPNVDPKVPKAARRASEMAWGSRSKELSQNFSALPKKVPWWHIDPIFGNYTK